MLKEKLDLFNGDFDNTEIKLEAALQLVRKNNVKSMQDEVETEIKNVEDEFQRIREYAERYTEFGDRLKELELNNYIQKALQLRDIE